MVGLLSILLAVGPVVDTAYADTTYLVQSGDSLSAIALEYGVTVEAIMAANNLPSRSTIYVGQLLTIPSPGANPAPPARNPSGQLTYTVQFGDTLSEIALQFGTTTEALARANGLSDNTIYAGQVLVIVSASSQAPPPNPPTNPPPQANPGTYIVQNGDNIITLAARFGITTEALAAANRISPTSFLYIGQVLTIPGRNPQPAPTATRPPPAPTNTPAPQPVAPARPAQYTVQEGDNLSTIAFKFNTTVEALQALNNLPDGNFLRVGQVLTITKGTAQNNNPPNATPSVPLGKFGPKWVDIAINSQTMVAYEGQTPVYTAKVSTGAPRRPTVEGTYRIYAKYRTQNMQGGTGAEYYSQPNVPYVMYFYSAYALHGANWHNNFGQPVSQGGVNLPEEAARWMYEWAPIGTMVVSHR